MELINNKYIILELIPTALTPEKGDIVQLSAIKVDGLRILSRFDYRLNEDKIYIPDFLDMISYDKSEFVYKDTTKEILEDFNAWSEDITILIMNNKYTIHGSTQQSSSVHLSSFGKFCVCSPIIEESNQGYNKNKLLGIVFMFLSLRSPPRVQPLHY